MENITLLLVDDEQLVCEGMRAFIDWAQYGITKILSAQNAFDAIEIAKLRRPEIVITDIRMPKMDGFELIEILQNELPQTLFIVLSGYDEFAYAKRALSLAAAGYLLKPVREEELCELIKSCVSRLEKEHERERVRENLRETLAKQESKKNDLLMSGLLYGSYLNEKQLTNSLREEGFDIVGQQYKLLLISPQIDSAFDDCGGIVDKVDEIGGLVCRVLENCGYKFHCLCGFPYLTVLFSAEGGELDTDALLPDIKRNIEAVFGISVRCYFGGTLDALVDIQGSFKGLINSVEGGRLENEPASAASQKMSEIKDYVRKNLSHSITLSELAKEFYYNPSYLSRRFKEETGMLFLDFLNGERIKLARKLISEGGRSTYVICEEVGYKDYRYFISIFKKYTGVTPYQYAQGKRGGSPEKSL